jgi:hypothetical protein
LKGSNEVFRRLLWQIKLLGEKTRGHSFAQTIRFAEIQGQKI